MKKPTGLVALAFIVVIGVISPTQAFLNGADTEDGDMVPRQNVNDDGYDAVQYAVEQLGMTFFPEPVAAEDFRLRYLTGGQGRLSDYRGQVVFLNFWATWCGPCRVEMPSMQSLYDEFAADGLAMIAVNVRETTNTVAPFIDVAGYTYPVMLDDAGRVSARYGVRGIPATYIIDRDGRIIAGKIGTRMWDTPAVFEAFELLLAQSPTEA